MVRHVPDAPDSNPCPLRYVQGEVQQAQENRKAVWRSDMHSDSRSTTPGTVLSSLQPCDREPGDRYLAPCSLTNRVGPGEPVSAAFRAADIPPGSNGARPSAPRQCRRQRHGDRSPCRGQRQPVQHGPDLARWLQVPAPGTACLRPGQTEARVDGGSAPRVIRRRLPPPVRMEASSGRHLRPVALHCAGHRYQRYEIRRVAVVADCESPSASPWLPSSAIWNMGPARHRTPRR